MSGFYAKSSIASAGNSAAPVKAPRPRIEPMPCPPRNAPRPYRRQRPLPPPPPPRPAAPAATPTHPFININPAAAAGMNLAKTVAGSAAAPKFLCADPLTDRPYTSTAGLNYSSSGSVHDPLSSVCLAAMVHHYFLEEEEARAGSCGRARCNCLDGACGGDAGTDSSNNDEADDGRLSPVPSSLPEEHLCEILEGVSSCTSNRELLLLVDVGKSMEEEVELCAPSLNLSGAEEDEEENIVDEALAISRLHRPVMRRLQQAGHNAAVCKSRWNHGDGLPAGEYDYIDVVVNVVDDNDDHHSKKCSGERFIVDIDFKAQFEIARASENYMRLLTVLPRIFVGKAERLKQIVKIMSNAAKRSLKQQGLHLPPWRKQRYMQAKWCSSYKRTTNAQESCAGDRLSNFRIAMRGPRLMSMEFTKEMDMAFFRAQAKAMAEQQQSRGQQRKKGQEDGVFFAGNRAGNCGTGPEGNKKEHNAGFVACAVDGQRSRRDVCTVMCTGWQPPAVRRGKAYESCAQQQARRNKGWASGLAHALEHNNVNAAAEQQQQQQLL